MNSHPPPESTPPQPSEPGLGVRALQSALWVFSLRFVQILCELARLIIVARLLAPSQFGLFGIAILSYTVLEIFCETGFAATLIQKRENARAYLNTAWTLGVMRGAAIALVLFFTAPYISSFFKAPDALWVIRVIGAASVVRSLTNPAAVFFEKELRFDKYFRYQFLGGIADVAAAIAVSIYRPTVWALVFGFLCGHTVRCLMSYAVDPFRPAPELNLAKGRELWGFGRWVFAASRCLARPRWDSINSHLRSPSSRRANSTIWSRAWLFRFMPNCRTTLKN
jgi:lipopolysaccharide exporter